MATILDEINAIKFLLRSLHQYVDDNSRNQAIQTEASENNINVFTYIGFNRNELKDFLLEKEKQLTLSMLQGNSPAAPLPFLSIQKRESSDSLGTISNSSQPSQISDVMRSRTLDEMPEIINNFKFDDGFEIVYPSKGSTSIIYDYGVIGHRLNEDTTVTEKIWCCLVSEYCERKPTRLSIKSNTSSCTDHIRSCHKDVLEINSNRNAKRLAIDDVTCKLSKKSKSKQSLIGNI